MRLEKYFQQIAELEKYADDITMWKKLEPSPDDVVEFAHRYINAEPPQERDERISLERLLASSSPSISDRYRFDERELDVDRNITNMMHQNKIARPIILYRGVSPVPFEAMEKSAREIEESDVTFYEKGFMSCSLLPTLAYKFEGKKQLRIYCPIFSKVLYLREVNKEEEIECLHECVIQRGAQLKLIAETEKYYCCLLLRTE